MFLNQETFFNFDKFRNMVANMTYRCEKNLLSSKEMDA